MNNVIEKQDFHGNTSFYDHSPQCRLDLPWPRDGTSIVVLECLESSQIISSVYGTTGGSLFSMLIGSGEDFNKYELCNFDLGSRLVKMRESSLFIPSEALHTSEYFSTVTLISPNSKNLLLLDNYIGTSDKNGNFGLLLGTNIKLDEYLGSISSKIDPTLFMSIEGFIDIAKTRNQLRITLN